MQGDDEVHNNIYACKFCPNDADAAFPNKGTNQHSLTTAAACFASRPTFSVFITMVSSVESAAGMKAVWVELQDQ